VTDTYDLLSTTESRVAIGLTSTDTSQDARLPSYVTAVSRRLDQLCGPIVQRTVTGETLDGGQRFVDLTYWPLQSLVSVTEYYGTAARTLTQETPGTVPTDSYVLYPWRAWYKGRLYRRSGGCDAYFPTGRGNVVVSYVAGRYANTAAVDVLFKQAASLTLSNIFRKEQRPVSPAFNSPDLLGDNEASSLPGFLLPYVVEQLLVDEILPGSA
jgi:hypothetical protein